MKRILAVLMGGLIVSVFGFAAEPSRLLTNNEAKELVAKASTPADHLRLAQYYQTRAEKLEAESKDHAAMAQQYRAHPTASETKRPLSPDTSSHCRYFSQRLADQATEAQTLATAHEEMAKQ